MVQQQFALNDGTKPKLWVVMQKSINYQATMIGYQISKVLDMENAQADEDCCKIPYRWIYEEIDLTTDFVTYARYMGEEHIRKNYSWVFE